MGVRIFYLQVFQNKFYKNLAASQHTSKVRVEPHRGDILDRRGRKIATSILTTSVYVHPKKISDVKKVSRILSEKLDIKEDVLKSRITSDKNFVWIKRKTDTQTGDSIRALKIEGLGVREERKRVYPTSELFSIVGYSDIDNKGIEGLEKHWDSLLSGSRGFEYYSVDARGRRFKALPDKNIDVKNGLEVVLSLDAIYQNIAYEALKKAVLQTGAKRGFIITGFPKTGEIITFVRYPSFDPNTPFSLSAESKRNFPVTDIFEPGSSFKVVTASAAIEEEIVELQDRFYCEQGIYNIGRFRLRDHKPFGWLTFKEVIEQSSNIGTAKIAMMLGPDKLYKYIDGFGFGKKTGIDMPGEVRGLIRPVSKWSKTSEWCIPMGQEVGVTGIQLYSMISTIANGGYWVQPYITDYFQSNDGGVRWMPKRLPARRVISERTAGLMEEILTGVVERGTGFRAKIPGVLVAGKTGTAQKIGADGRYSADKFIASFVGYVKTDDISIAGVVVIDEPQTSPFGSVVAAPVFKEVCQKILAYMVDESLQETSTTIAQLRSRALR